MASTTTRRPQGAPGAVEITLDHVRRAATRIAPHVQRTPVFTCGSLDLAAGRRLFFKCELFQKTGSFKIRGATNAVRSLSDEAAARGVVTHSSGNHAAALAAAAAARGIAAHVVMPSNSNPVKRRAVEGYGARVYTCEPTLEARETTARRVLLETGGVLIPPYDHPDIIAGQGTAALELLEEVPGLDCVVAPVGGGGLCSGTSVAAHGVNPRLVVVGAEPAGADDAARSLAAGRVIPQTGPRTICDGLLTSLSELTFSVIRAHVQKIVTPSDEAIIAAMRMLWERAKLMCEPSSAVTLAAVLDDTFPVPRGSAVGLILSGGNVDLDRLPWSGR